MRFRFLLCALCAALASGCGSDHAESPASVAPAAPGAVFRTDDPALEWVRVDPGVFRMGSVRGQGGRTVRLSRVFWLATTETTQRQYKTVTGENPSSVRGDNLPAVNVTWHEAMRFCHRLTEREQAAGRLPEGLVFRLPTEAEWEFAARGGMQAHPLAYSGSDVLDEVGWHAGNSGGKPRAVGKLLPNALGLYDMSGNAGEWCYDWWQSRLRELPDTDPTGARAGPCRVHRGGGWRSRPEACQVDFRNYWYPDLHSDTIGFRVALAAPLPEQARKEEAIRDPYDSEERNGTR